MQLQFSLHPIRQLKKRNERESVWDSGFRVCLVARPSWHEVESLEREQDGSPEVFSNSEVTGQGFHFLDACIERFGNGVGR